MSAIRAPSQPAIPGDYQYRAMRSGPALQRFWHRGKLDVMDLVLPIEADDVVIDVGCGSGNLSVRAARRSRQVIGIDPCFEAVKFCRFRPEPEAGSCEFAVALGDRLPFPRASADVALFVEVLEHIREPRRILAEIHDALKPGGRLLVTTPNYGPGSLWPLLEWLADKSGLVAAMADEQHVAAYSPQSLGELLESAGFAVERIGTFYRTSPVAALVAPHRARRILEQEVAGGGQAGALVFALARRKV